LVKTYTYSYSPTKLPTKILVKNLNQITLTNLLDNHFNSLPSNHSPMETPIILDTNLDNSIPTHLDYHIPNNPSFNYPNGRPAYNPSFPLNSINISITHPSGFGWSLEINSSQLYSITMEGNLISRMDTNLTLQISLI
jgi:hypothetical protein